MLLLLFVTVPMVELYLLLTVGSFIGVGPTFAIILITGALGASMARREGIKALRRVQDAMAQGRMPGEEITGGLLVLVGGLLLLTPGFMTDIFGFFCLIPATRGLMVSGMQKALAGQVRAAGVQFGDSVIINADGQMRSHSQGTGRHAGGANRQIIDVEGDELS